MYDKNAIKEELINIQTGEKLDFDKISKLKDNKMLKVRPDLWCDWDFERNNELELDIYKITYGSVKKVWWICPKCESNYDANINNRFYNNNCPYCVGKKVNHTNSLASLNPTVASEWHLEMNGDLTPNDVTYGSNKKAWWRGKCDHEWETTISHRTTRNTGCPYCSNTKLLAGFNDMWTTNPKLASLLLYPEDGYKFMQNSHSRTDWQCPTCNEIVLNKDIRAVNNFGLSCPNCSDGFTLPEKIVYFLLKQLNIKFESEKVFNWSDGKRYDFFIPSNNILIETHGGQHSGKGFSNVGGRTLKEEQENDKIKYEMAIKNNINKYIVIDARYSDFEYIKSNIVKSQLVELFDLTRIDWIKIEKQSASTIVKEVCDIWNSGLKILKQISETSNLSRSTVSRYLKQGSKLGWCDYSIETSSDHIKRKIVRISPNGSDVVEYCSISEAERSNNFPSRSGITKVCRGEARTCKGYIFMYYEDFVEYKKGNRELIQNPKKENKIVQLDLNNNLIQEYNNISEASNLLNINYKLIHRVCSKKREVTYGFKWMYKEDYEKMLQEKQNIN